MTHLACVGCAGTYLFRQPWPQQIEWQLMDTHISSFLRARNLTATVLEQDVLPVLQLRHNDLPPLRIVLETVQT